MYKSHERVSCFTALVALVINLFLCNLLPANPTITEFLSINDSVLADIDGEFNDWVEESKLKYAAKNNLIANKK